MESTSHRTFTIELCLGRGGFGEVYRAEMSSPAGLTSRVALKVLRRDLAPGSQAVERLRDEGALLARLNHPDPPGARSRRPRGRVALVTEFVDGDDLEHCIRGADRIGPRAASEVLAQVASALDAAYNLPVLQGLPLKLVHRDVKPSNVRLGRHGEVKLLDFGIARSDEVTREARTLTDMMVGSPPYMAPERFLDGELRPASDVFALGAIGLEVLLGSRLFGVPVPVLASLAIDRRRYEDFLAERLTHLPADAPEPYVTLCRSLVAYDPESRPLAAEVSARFDRLVDALEGATLARWSRDRHWQPAQREVGELDGRVLSEGTLARDAWSRETWGGLTSDVRPLAAPAPPPAVAPSAGRWVRRIAWLGGGALSFAFAVPLAAAAIGLAWYAWPRDGAAVAPPIEAPAPRVRPVREAPSPEQAAPEPEHAAPEEAAPAAPVREPPASEPRPPTARDPAPERVVEAPVAVVQPVQPAPPARAPAQETVRVTLSGAERAWLERHGARVDLPGSVAPGSWTLHVRWGTDDGPKIDDQPVEIEAGHPMEVSCGTRFWTCRAVAR
ncbi:MAG: serine/threonine-protein kinase [Myxococcota bacterium]